MKVIVLFKKSITLAFQKMLFCFSTINIFLFIGKNVLIIGNFMPIIDTFLPLNKKILIVEKNKCIFWKARVMGFLKSTITFM